MAVLTDVMSRIETGGLTLHTFDSRKAIDKHKARIQRKTQLFGQKKYLKRWAQLKGARDGIVSAELYDPTPLRFIWLLLPLRVDAHQQEFLA